MPAKRIHRLLLIVSILLLIASCVSAISCGDDDDDNNSADVDDDDTASPDDDADDDADDDEVDDDTVSPDDDAPDGPLVFVQFTDIHQSRGSHTNKGQYENWLKSLTYVRDVVTPEFVVATGDLTDGAGPFGQTTADWEDYHNAVVDAGYTTDDYYDMPGNHDGHNDDDFSYYLEYGVSGAITHAWQRQWNDYEYAFVATQTAQPDSMEGVFRLSTYNWTDEQLALVEDADHIFVFAHHNSFIVPDAGLLGSGGLLDTYDVTAMVAGHRHLDMEITDNETRFIKTAAHYLGMPDSDDGWMRIFVLSGSTWACAAKYVVDRGPQVIITSPQAKRLAVARNPEGHIVGGETTITAMAFGEGDITLTAKVDDSPPAEMDTEDGRVFTMSFDFGAAPAGEHTIRVEDPNRINNVNGVDSIKVVSE